MTLADKSIVYENSEDSNNSKTIRRASSVSKSGSSYTVANGSFVNINDEDNGKNTVTIASADVGFPRSETIAAIGHRSGDLEPVQVLKKSVKRNEENDDNGEFCRKCGHYSKR